MKNRVHSKAAAGVLGCILAFAACALQAQFAVNWHKIAGGGGVSSNGGFQIAGTIGQHDAGPSMKGDIYSITGGFWAIHALQTPGAPLLRILITSTNTVKVYWPSPSTGFNLQGTSNLGSTNWPAPPQTISDDGTNRYIIVNPPTGHQYYRLVN